MNKKISTLMLTAIALLICFSSCVQKSDPTPLISPTPTPSAISSTIPKTTLEITQTASPTTTDNKTKEYPNEFHLTGSPFIYNNFVYYLSANYDNHTFILKYQDLNDIQEYGTPVYNNPEDDENLFGGLQCQMLVDEEATDENNGIPVLIIGVSGVDYTGTTNYYTQIYRFNQKTNELKQIFNEQKKLRLDGMCLYGDTLYFKGFYRNSQNTEDTYHVYYSVNKNGGKATKHSFTGYVSEYLGIYKDTMYFYDSISGDIIVTDLNYENERTLTNIATQSISVMKPLICGEYIYYTANLTQTEREGCKIISGDICRRSLVNLMEELVVKGVSKAYVSGDNIIYGLESEATVETVTFKFYDKETTYSFKQDPILYLKKITTGHSKVFLDISNNEEDRKYLGLFGIQGDYALFGFDTDDSSNIIYRLYDLENGKLSSFSNYSK